MNYIGSKYRLSAFLKNTITTVVGNNLQDKVLCDIFAGTGIVGRSFKNDVQSVISNDIEFYSYVLNKNFIENHKPLDYENYLMELDILPLRSDGFVYQNYCTGSGSGRQYFSDFNGKKIDTLRLKIEEWKEHNEIENSLYYFLLASLLESADKIANTASVYGAFLKHIKKSAQKELKLEPALFELSHNSHQVFNEDSNQLIKQIEGDILYLDPPYNARQYGANYHLLNTIAKYDPFKPSGKTGLPEYYRSQFCKKQEVHKTFENLIENACFKHVFLSYNNEGLMSENDVKLIMQKFGKYKLFTTRYQRFKADRDENRNHKATQTTEYLHYLEKR